MTINCPACQQPFCLVNEAGELQRLCPACGRNVLIEIANLGKPKPAASPPQETPSPSKKPRSWGETLAILGVFVLLGPAQIALGLAISGGSCIAGGVSWTAFCLGFGVGRLSKRSGSAELAVTFAILCVVGIAITLIFRAMVSKDLSNDAIFFLTLFIGLLGMICMSVGLGIGYSDHSLDDIFKNS